MEKFLGKNWQKKGSFRLKDIGSSTILVFFPNATLKEPQTKNTTLLILHGIFSKFNFWLLDTKYNLLEISHVLVCA